MIRHLIYYTYLPITHQMGNMNKIRNSTKKYVDAFIYKNKQNIPLQ
jgi:hypothetical protein